MIAANVADGLPRAPAYFVRDLGFKIYAIEGVSTQDEPSSKKLVDLINTIKNEGVQAVFFESIENPKVVTGITKETGAQVGGELYDGLGDETASTYTDMVRYNIATIGASRVVCLGIPWVPICSCAAPKRFFVRLEGGAP